MAPSRGEEASESSYDRLWAQAVLYEGTADSLVQSLELSGRLQLDLAYVENEDSDHGEFNVRRFRFGFKTQFLEDFTLHIEADFDPQEVDPFYVRLTDTYLAWQASPYAIFTLGKQSAGFTLDGMTSSKNLITIDRNNLTNNIWFTAEYIPGVSVKGAREHWSYFVGLFSSGDESPEFGDFEGGEFLLVTLGHDFAEALGARQALLRLNYVDNEPDSENGFTRDLDEIVSLNFAFEADDWGLRTDLSAARGYFDQSDLWGVVVMPFYGLTERAELVGRYTFVESKNVNGVRFARYESTVADGRGDRYDELYLGYNYYWYGHKLKLQNGAQYVDMRDRADDGGAYRGLSWTTGFRISW